jgi:hypothetical protein
MVAARAAGRRLCGHVYAGETSGMAHTQSRASAQGFSAAQGRGLRLGSRAKAVARMDGRGREGPASLLDAVRRHFGARQIPCRMGYRRRVGARWYCMVSVVFWHRMGYAMQAPLACSAGGSRQVLKCGTLQCSSPCAPLCACVRAGHRASPVHHTSKSPTPFAQPVQPHLRGLQ